MIRILISVLFMVTNILATADLLLERAIIDFEPNNSIDAAESIEFDRDVDGNISGESDVDYYKFSVDQRLKLSIAFDADPFEAYDTDSDGLGNIADLDDDNDGFSDAEEDAAGTDLLNTSSCPDCFSFDIDNDGEAKALTDGLLVIRHLFGFSGEALTAGAVGMGAKRSTSSEIAAYLTSAANELDIDGDGEAKALTDGLLLIRELFGFSGSALTAGAVGEAGLRATESAIEAYIAERLPDSIGSGGGSGEGSADGGTSDGSTDGGTSDGSTDGGSVGTKTIEINVVYDRVPYCDLSCSGLDYTSTRQDPVRFAMAEVLDAATSEVLKADLMTSESGSLSFELANDVSFKVRVYAKSKGNGVSQWGLRIVNNGGSAATGNYPLYSLDSGAISVGAITKSIEMRATSGWSGAGYTSTRSAAPFAILDSMITASLYALSGRNNLSFDPVDVYWSTQNSENNVGTSFFSGEYIMVLGDADADTDEYDESIIIHEWGHYFQSIASRDDSIGGSHGSGDLLDMRVAFSEGWANALSGLAAGIDRYQDSGGSQQGGGFSRSLENALTESQGAVKGWYSEDSVQTVIFDFFDAEDNDDETLALPASAMMTTLLDYMPNQAAGTSIFSFGAGLIESEPQRKAKILELFAAEGIGASAAALDIFGQGETNSGQQYTSEEDIDIAILPVYRQISSSLRLDNICQESAFGTFNKLGNYSFARFTVPVSGSYRVEVVSTTSPPGSTTDPDFELFSAKGSVGPSFGELTAAVGNETHDLVLEAGDHWLWVQDYNNNVASGVSGRYCQTVEISQ